MILGLDSLRADTQLTLDEPGRATGGLVSHPWPGCVLFCARFADESLSAVLQNSAWGPMRAPRMLSPQCGTARPNS